LTAAGVGAALLLARFRPRFGVAHVVTALVYAFGPYSATFLVPSNLYFHYALAPWLVVTFLRAVDTERSWRWAAAFALLVFAAGNVDVPGLAYALIPTLLAAAYVVLVERRGRYVVDFAVRAAPLCLAVSAAAITKVWAASAVFASRLAETEAPDVPSLTSSWSESWRGLGFWLSYFRDTGGLSRPQGEVFFTSPAVILATSLLAAAAVAVVAVARVRGRSFFLACLLVALVLMVAAYPPEDPSPFGQLLLDLYDRVPGLASLRSGYKAGAGMMIGVASLAGIGYSMAVERLRDRGPGARVLGVGGLALVLLLAATPFWSGDLYHPSLRVDEVPDYWYEAAEHLDAGGDGRILFLPPTTRTPYRWGEPGDDILDALVARDHAVDTSITLSTPTGADALRALSDELGSPDYRPGVVDVLARRLGIDTIVLRNDVDWQDAGTARPSDYDGLRTDPAVALEATFGPVGQLTVAEGATGDRAQAEADLPPIEVYRLRDVEPVPTHPADAEVLVAGSADAFGDLAAIGLVDETTPTGFSATRDGEELVELLDRGATVVVTDQNRRQLNVVAGYQLNTSHTLADGEDLNRPTDPLFAVEGAESVAWYPDATRISADQTPRSSSGFLAERRPAAAFDGDLRTGWATPTFLDPVGQALRVDLRERRVVDEIVLRDGRGIDG
ncbi:MAG: alpha-(1-_3)-arabinofuranosyltransferase family protein, partial [Actinomycetota bacterium]